MRVLRREWFNTARGDQWTIVPIGDVHIGSVACDEDLLQQTIQRIRHDDRCLWLGMGDYAEWINTKDPRFDYGVLAKWIDMSDLHDLARAQRDHLLDLLKPIAPKCLGLVKGNHEDTIQRWTERDVYADLVAEMKAAGGFETDYRLGLGWSGWLSLHYYRSEQRRQRATWLRVYCHHGNAGGRYRGGKALRMERALMFRDADLVIYGHSHNADVMPVAVEGIDNKENLVTQVRKGMYSGTFLRTTVEDATTYSERAEYPPLPAIGSPEVTLRPGAKLQQDRVRITV